MQKTFLVHVATTVSSHSQQSLSRVSFDHDKHSTVHPIGVTEGSNENDQTNYTVGVYVATVYDHDRKWFVGMILERCEEKVDVLVKFMHPAQSQKLAWPSRPDICWVPLSHVLCCLSVPTLQGRSAQKVALV